MKVTCIEDCAVADNETKLKGCCLLCEKKDKCQARCGVIDTYIDKTKEFRCDLMRIISE